MAKNNWRSAKPASYMNNKYQYTNIVSGDQIFIYDDEDEGWGVNYSEHGDEEGNDKYFKTEKLALSYAKKLMKIHND